MKFGVREICDVVFRAKYPVKIGSHTYETGEPVLYIDSAKTSTIEGAATTVYAQGGRGNARLIAWEGEKTLTFTVEDALLSPISFSMLSGAGLIKGAKAETVHVHKTLTGVVQNVTTTGSVTTGYINAEEFLSGSEIITSRNEDEDNDGVIDTLFYAMKTVDGEVVDDNYSIEVVTENPPTGLTARKAFKITAGAGATLKDADTFFIDFYVEKTSSSVSELQIDAKHFAGYYYVEASTLFRQQSTGLDLPAEITFPNIKIQSNFTFSMASSGDPSTFTFTMDAFPGYTYFDKTKKVLCVMQVIDENIDNVEDLTSVM